MVPNLFPKHDSHHRLALIGESPGPDEVRSGEPFTGASGRFLAALLSRAGTSREACLLANVCQENPARNEIASFDWMGDEIQSGIAQLKKDLEAYKPNLIVCLGGTPLHLLKAGNFPPRKAKKQGRLVFNWPNKPTNWRGSFFASTFGPKALATLHPAYVLRDYETAPLLQLDLKKAVRGATIPLEKLLPVREFDLDPNRVLTNLAIVKQVKPLVAIDIEGGINSMSCISFAVSPSNAFIVPFFYQNGSRCFLLEEEVKVWRALADVLEDLEIPKVLQNSLYDRFILQYTYRIRVRGVREDIMVKHWEKYAELEKSLAVQASIYTNEPYWKYQRKETEPGK